MKENKYDLAVIGGGPAGMIAAGRAGELGSRVILIEKNEYLGKKLLMTGKGRCNITNAEENLRLFINKYGEQRGFLYSVFNRFSNKNVIKFFNNLGLKTKTERGQRVFPVSENSRDVLRCLKKYLRKNKVEVCLKNPVRKVILDQNNTKKKKIEKIILKKGQEIKANNYLIATGGKTYPQTGSTGEGYQWLKKMGHSIIPPKPVLTQIIVQEKIIKKLEGLSLKNVEISLWDKKKIDSRFGEAIFTNNGLSGPIILDLSKIVSDNKDKELTLKIDFKPALDYPKLDKRILRDFEEEKNKQFKNSLDKLLPQKLIPIIIQLSGIKKEKKVNEITKEERKKITKLLKEFSLKVKGLAGFEKAIITSGGIDLKEIDPKTMKSKIVDNLYLAGEIIDVDGPTGGYNLQIAWSTGYLSGESSFTKKTINMSY